ncbi:MAG: hypothetical protein ABDH29_00015 [Aquificaceae bacterium]
MEKLLKVSKALLVLARRVDEKEIERIKAVTKNLTGQRLRV